MVTGRYRPLAFRLVFALYALGLFAWLLLGFVPFVATHVGFVHEAFVSAAARDSVWGRTASRVLHPDTMADATTTSQTVIQYLFSAANATLGLLLVARRPDDRVPRLLGFALLGTAATFNLPSHRAFHIIGSAWPVATLHFTFHIVSGVTYVWAVILFPDGRPPPQIHLGARAQAAIAALFTALVAFGCWRSSFLAHPQFFVVFFGIAVPLTGIAAQVLRLRDPGTTALDRRVARTLCGALLPAFATALGWLAARLGAAVTSGAAHADADLAEVRIATWFPVVFAVVPVVLSAAVLRYRLWDVDRWLTRVLAYGLLAIAIGVGYVLAVVVVASVFGRAALWASVLTLAVIATVLEPIRVALRRWANRVVFGVSLDPQEALRNLSDGLDRLSPAGELDRLTQVALHATRASSVRLWSVDGDDVRCAAAAPNGTSRAATTIADLGRGPDLAAALGESFCAPVRHQGVVLGLLGVTIDDHSSMPAADRVLLADIADHAGLLVHNATLTISLARQADRLDVAARRLHRARRRLVTAQDSERRRLERNLHDGAQQALVAALIDIGRVDAPLSMSTARHIVAVATESLTELLTTDRPAVLDEVGLAAAVERAAAPLERLGVVVSVRVHGCIVESEITTSVYFCCVEVLQNVAKYACARNVAVVFDVEADELAFTVTDDGIGFDARSVDAAGGLRRLDERLAVVGGTLTVESRRGAGTRVAGRVPARIAAPASA